MLIGVSHGMSDSAEVHLKWE